MRKRIKILKTITTIKITNLNLNKNSSKFGLRTIFSIRLQKLFFLECVIIFMYNIYIKLRNGALKIGNYESQKN